MRDKMRVTENMLDALFRAAKRVGKRGDEAAQLAAARSGQRIIIDGTYAGVLTIDTRCSAYVSLLSWCMEHEEALGDLALEIVEQINDEDRAHSPAVMAAIGAVFCRGTRSPASVTILESPPSCRAPKRGPAVAVPGGALDARRRRHDARRALSRARADLREDLESANL